jgi:hypothetical protein
MNGEQVAAVSIAAIIVWGIALSMWAQAWASRRKDSAKPERFQALEGRLERVEQAIDAVAVEVERIGEAHRFTAKLLSDRLEPLPAAKAGREEPNG